ncbi:hypothetical protein HNP84_007344 [Thermocatellispora tengchongensis]|uniref:Uncharacterized protein n=1 Tax=Thermocatellispora tengchongensis TaxID=1073253 RepID=A0A840PEI9_9ACTN|nr:hypothetical protein [Thermocatellispora tengchongensis]MBB5137592.1 hypothetical protein [Thermocatellispora tengchongensis]
MGSQAGEHLAAWEALAPEQRPACAAGELSLPQQRQLIDATRAYIEALSAIEGSAANGS